MSNKGSSKNVIDLNKKSLVSSVSLTGIRDTSGYSGS